MVGRLLKRLATRWPRLLRRVRAEDCHMTVRPLPQGVKVNSTFVDLNYCSLSPFADPLIVYQVRGPDLLLWFIRPAAAENALLVIPEAILLARSHRGNRAARAIVYRQQGRIEVTVIEQGWVVAQLICTSPDEAHLQRTLDLLKRQHGLKTLAVQNLSAAEYLALLDQGLGNIGLRDLPGFSRARQGDQQLLISWSATLLPVVLAGLVLFTSLQLGGAWFAQRRVGQLQDEFAGLQQELRPLFGMRKIIETRVAFWQQFVDREQQYPGLGRIYGVVAAVIARDGGLLKRFNGSRGRVQVTVVVADAARLAEQLRALPDLALVRFEGPVRKDRKTGLQQAALVCELNKKTSG